MALLWCLFLLCQPLFFWEISACVVVVVLVVVV
jgi:hypothetical protein